MKIRKILPLLLLLLVCILCLCACGETKDNSSSQSAQGKPTDVPAVVPPQQYPTQVPMLDPYADVTGKWWTGYADYIRLEGATETNSNNARVTLAFDGNGNYNMTIADFGRDISGTYTLNNGRIMIGSFGPFDCAVQGGCLYLSSQEDNIRVVLYSDY